MTSYPLFVCGQMVLLESPELAAALSALSQMDQEIIFLYYFQRLTHREIGRRYYEMKIPNATCLAQRYGITRQAADKRLKKIEEKIKKLVAIF